MDSEAELSCSFRFLSLTELQAQSLKLLDLDINFGRHFKTNKITAFLELSEEVIPFLKDFVNANDIATIETDVFISVVSEYDSEIFDIPTCVNEAVIELGSKLVFSYTCV